jgi:hypothetical protein
LVCATIVDRFGPAIGADVGASRFVFVALRHEVLDAVLGGHFAGGHSGPDHRRKRGTQRRQLSGGSSLQEPGDHRQVAALDKRQNDVPLQAVDPQQ